MTSSFAAQRRLWEALDAAGSDNAIVVHRDDLLAALRALIEFEARWTRICAVVEDRSTTEIDGRCHCGSFPIPHIFDPNLCEEV